MNKFRKTLIGFLSASCLVCVGAFTAACTQTENPPEPTVTYTVTLDYNAEQGEVTLTPYLAAYEAGDEVTVSVSAADGYAVDTFTVSSDAAAVLNEVGNYTLVVTEDTTVTVTFKAEEDVQPAEGKFPEYLQGTWNGFGAEGYVVTITEDALAVADGDGNAVEATFTVSTLTGEFGETMTVATVTLDGVTYELTTYAQDNVLAFESESVTLYFVTENLPAYSFSEAVYGTWTGEGLDYPVEIDENGLFFEKEGLLVFAMNDDEFGYYEYVVIVDGVLYTVTLSGENLYFGDYALTKVVENVPDAVPFDPVYAGTWTGEGNTLVVDEEGNVTWNGQEAVPFNDGMMGFYVNGEYNYVNLSAVNVIWVMGANVELTKTVASLEEAGLVGTWKSLGSDTEYTITATATSFSLKSYDPTWGLYDDVAGILNVEFVEDYGETYLFATFYWYVNGEFVAYDVVPMGGDNLLTIQYYDYETWEDYTVLFVKEGLSALTPDESLYGTWVDEEGMYEESLVVSAEGVFWGDTELTVIHAYEEDGAQIAYLVSDESAFMIMYVEGYFYFFDIVTYEPYAMLVKAAEEGGDFELPEWLLGTSFLNLEGWGLLTIDENGAINWLGYDLTVLAFDDTSNDILSNHFTATVSLDGTVYTLEGSDTGFTATNNDDGIETVFNFVAVAETINSAFRGTWTTPDGSMSIEITDTMVTDGYTEYSTVAYDGYTLYVSTGYSVSTITLYEGDANVLFFTISSYGYTLTYAYIKNGANVGVDGIDWPGLVGTWQTADGETLTLNKDGTAVWAGHTVIVLSTSESLVNGKQDRATLLIDADIVEIVVDIVNNVPGELVINLGYTNYTFTKISDGDSEESGEEALYGTWTGGIWTLYFDTDGTVEVSDGSTSVWVDFNFSNGEGEFFWPDTMNGSRYTFTLNDDGTMTLKCIYPSVNVTLTKDGSTGGGDVPSDDPFAGTWYGQWDGWVLTIVSADDVTLTNGTVTYTGTYFYSSFLGELTFTFKDSDGVFVSFDAYTNDDFTSFTVDYRDGIDIEIGTCFTKDESTGGGSEILPDPDAKFADEHVGTWNFIDEEGIYDGYDMDLVLYADGRVDWAGLEGLLYFVEDYADDWGFINYTVYFYDYEDFFILQYLVENGTLNLWLGAGMDYYFTKGGGESESPLAEFVGTWNVVVEAGTLGSYQLVITEDGVAVYLEDTLLTSSYTVGEWNVVTISFKQGDDTFTYELNLDTDILLSLWANGEVALYFLKEGYVAGSVNAKFAGTWTAEDADYNLVIGVDGSVSYGPDFGIVVGAEEYEEFGYYMYRVLFGTTLGIIEISDTEYYSSFTFILVDDGYYEMTKVVKEAVYVPADYRNKTYSGDGHTLTIDENGNVYIDDVLCELTNVDDSWGYPYCNVVWNGAEWTLEIEPYGYTYVQLHYGYDDWYTLNLEGGSSAEVSVPAELLGTTWTATGNNSYADKTWNKTITIEFALDGTITVTIDGTVYTVTLVKVQEGAHHVEEDWEWDEPYLLEVRFPGDGVGDEVTWQFSGDFGSGSFESYGMGYAFDATKNA